MEVIFTFFLNYWNFPEILVLLCPEGRGARNPYSVYGGIRAKKMGRRRWGGNLIGGFFPPHTLLPKEEKEEKCNWWYGSAKRVP